MSKTKIVTIFAVVLAISFIQAQSFTSGSLLLHLNAGIEGLNTEYTYQLKNSSLDTMIKDNAANSNFFLGLEYGLLKWFGVGLKGKINKYFTEEDKITGSKPSANSFDVVFTVRAHLFRTKHFDLPIGIGIGGSSLTYDNNDPNYPITIYGKGTYFDIHLQPMLYFDKFGVNVYFGLPSINYKDMSSSDSNVNQYILMHWKGNGIVLGIGLQYRFLN